MRSRAVLTVSVLTLVSWMLADGATYTRPVGANRWRLWAIQTA